MVQAQFKLKELLFKRNISQKELSELTKIRPTTISSYCNNTAKAISLNNISMICNVLKCNIEDFIICESNPKTSNDISDEINRLKAIVNQHSKDIEMLKK